LYNKVLLLQCLDYTSSQKHVDVLMATLHEKHKTIYKYVNYKEFIAVFKFG